MCINWHYTPPSLVALYQWHDGVKDYTQGVAFFDDLTFMPLSDAVREHHYLLDCKIEIMPHCIPIAYENGDYLVIYCGAAKFQGFAHPIIELGELRFLKHESLESLIETSIVIHQHDWIYSGGTPSDIEQARLRFSPRIDTDIYVE